MDQTISRYRLEARLGRGRYCETYHAFDLVRRRPVALKLLHPDLLSSTLAFQKFLEQVGRATELVHPRLAWVWETGEVQGRYYFTERFIGGEALAARLERAEHLPWEQAFQIIEQTAQAIEFAEERGWRHGRVNPHNILLSADLGTVLSDYGLVNALNTLHPDFPASFYELQYLPPEPLTGQPASGRIDQYALACILIEMLIGKQPYAADSQEQMLEMKAMPLSEVLLLESLPFQASEVIGRALNPEPAARFDSALAFVNGLERAVRLGLTEPAARAHHEERLQRWRAAEEQARLEAEEIIRQSALEQARREIQERARQEAEQALNWQEENAPPVEAQRPAALRRRAVPMARWQRFWPALVVLGMAALLLAGYWMGERRSLAGQTQPSPTGTNTSLVATLPQAAPPTTSAPTSTMTSTVSATATSTLFRTSAPTITRTPSPSATLTITATPVPPSSTATSAPPANNPRNDD